MGEKKATKDKKNKGEKGRTNRQNHFDLKQRASF